MQFIFFFGRKCSVFCTSVYHSFAARRHQHNGCSQNGPLLWLSSLSFIRSPILRRCNATASDAAKICTFKVLAVHEVRRRDLAPLHRSSMPRLGSVTLHRLLHRGRRSLLPTSSGGVAATASLALHVRRPARARGPVTGRTPRDRRRCVQGRPRGPAPSPSSSFLHSVFYQNPVQSTYHNLVFSWKVLKRISSN